ncbi:MAG: hypothetical protein ABFD04_12545 [Syntrophomonas sp.]
MSGKTEAASGLDQQQERILQLHQEYSHRYPGLSLRWSRIYGSRWAHFLGGGAAVSFAPYKLALNNNFGLCIENPEILDPADLDIIVSELKGEFA